MGVRGELMGRTAKQVEKHVKMHQAHEDNRKEEECGSVILTRLPGLPTAFVAEVVADNGQIIAAHLQKNPPRPQRYAGWTTTLVTGDRFEHRTKRGACEWFELNADKIAGGIFMFRMVFFLRTVAGQWK